MKKIVIFTDLDGTLLDPAYSFDAALPALALIRARKIPLVLCSSKTRIEIEGYKKRLENYHPFISENGGGIFIPDAYFSQSPAKATFKANKIFSSPAMKDKVIERLADYHVVVLGKPYEEIRKVFSALRKDFNIMTKGFGDMTAEDVAELTGLPIGGAALAKLRDFSEPFIFERGTPEDKFLKAIEASGFHWTQGKFHHIMGDSDKGKATNIMKGLFEQEYGKIHTIGLGDGLNDLPMLKEVDQPVLIPKEYGSCDPRVKIPDLIKAEETGPDGWNKAIMGILKRM